MSTEQHESLKLADRLIEAACVVDAGRPAVMSDFRRRAAANLQSQHALIVQMAEALDDMSRIYTPTDGARNAHAAATQYLKGPKT